MWRENARRASPWQWGPRHRGRTRTRLPRLQGATTKMPRLIFSLVPLFALVTFTTGAAADVILENPLLRQRADPHVFLHADGQYYFTATVPEYDRIEIRRTRDLNSLATAETKVIWRKH